jgi:hypothetical protein
MAMDVAETTRGACAWTQGGAKEAATNRAAAIRGRNIRSSIKKSMKLVNGTSQAGAMA